MNKQNMPGIKNSKNKLDPMHKPKIYHIRRNIPHSVRMRQKINQDDITDHKNRIKEHERALQLSQLQKSALTDHALGEGQKVQFADAKVLVKTSAGLY